MANAQINELPSSSRRTSQNDQPSTSTVRTSQECRQTKSNSNKILKLIKMRNELRARAKVLGEREINFDDDEEEENLLYEEREVQKVILKIERKLLKLDAVEDVSDEARKVLKNALVQKIPITQTGNKNLDEKLTQLIASKRGPGMPIVTPEEIRRVCIELRDKELITMKSTRIPAPGDDYVFPSFITHISAVVSKTIRDVTYEANLNQYMDYMPEGVDELPKPPSLNNLTTIPKSCSIEKFVQSVSERVDFSSPLEDDSISIDSNECDEEDELESVVEDEEEYDNASANSSANENLRTNLSNIKDTELIPEPSDSAAEASERASKISKTVMKESEPIDKTIDISPNTSKSTPKACQCMPEPSETALAPILSTSNASQAVPTTSGIKSAVVEHVLPVSQPSPSKSKHIPASSEPALNIMENIHEPMISDTLVDEISAADGGNASEKALAKEDIPVMEANNSMDEDELELSGDIGTPRSEMNASYSSSDKSGLKELSRILVNQAALDILQSLTKVSKESNSEKVATSVKNIASLACTSSGAQRDITPALEQESCVPTNDAEQQSDSSSDIIVLNVSGPCASKNESCVSSKIANSNAQLSSVESGQADSVKTEILDDAQRIKLQEEALKDLNQPLVHSTTSNLSSNIQENSVPVQPMEVSEPPPVVEPTKVPVESIKAGNDNNDNEDANDNDDDDYEPEVLYSNCSNFSRSEGTEEDSRFRHIEEWLSKHDFTHDVALIDLDSESDDEPEKKKQKLNDPAVSSKCSSISSSPDQTSMIVTDIMAKSGSDCHIMRKSSSLQSSTLKCRKENIETLNEPGCARGEESNKIDFSSCKAQAQPNNQILSNTIPVSPVPSKVCKNLALSMESSSQPLINSRSGSNIDNNNRKPASPPQKCVLNVHSMKREPRANEIIASSTSSYKQSIAVVHNHASVEFNSNTQVQTISSNSVDAAHTSQEDFDDDIIILD